MDSCRGNWQTVGHPGAVALLERCLSQGRISHAYLFVGPQHVGKMTLALDLARAVNCAASAPPCGGCPSCQRIAAGKHSDIRGVSLSSYVSDPSTKGKRRTEIGIQEIKDLIEQASLPPFEGARKVFLIDGAERLSVEAANALLKTLEEPPKAVLFILLSSREQAVLPTITSRCQRVELSPLPAESIAGLLAQRYGVAGERAQLLARLSSGCPGWAFSALTDDRELNRRKQDLETICRVPSLKYGERFAAVAEWLKRSEQPREDSESVLDLWLRWIRDVALFKSGCNEGLINIDYSMEMGQQASLFDMPELVASVEAVRRAKEQIALNGNTKLALEFLMLNIPTKGRPSPA